MVSWNVVAMFPNIDNNLGINAITDALHSRAVKIPSTDCIVEAVKICLQHNNSQFQKERSREYQEYLINRGYNPRNVQQQFNKVTSIPRENLLTPKIREKNVLFPLVTDFKRAAGIFTSESSDEQLFGTDMTAVLQRYLKHEYRAKALQ